MTLVISREDCVPGAVEEAPGESLVFLFEPRPDPGRAVIVEPDKAVAKPPSPGGFLPCGPSGARLAFEPAKFLSARQHAERRHRNRPPALRSEIPLARDGQRRP